MEEIEFSLEWLVFIVAIGIAGVCHYLKSINKTLEKRLEAIEKALSKDKE